MMLLPPARRLPGEPAQSRGRIHRPDPGFGRPARRPEEVLLVCHYDPAGISTVLETVAFMQSASRFSVTVLNMFEHRMDSGFLRMHPSFRLDRFDAVVIHNTVSYNAANAAHLDASLGLKMRDFEGAKILMKQDENFRMRELAEYIGQARFDLVLTCLPPEAVPLVYPPAVVGDTRFERMLTGYVTPTLRARDPLAQPRPVDIGYRGSIQPLSFGRLAYEKRTIGEDVAARLQGRADVVLDISSRWEDRLGGAAWLDFLSSCKATLGAESGASVFDLDGDLEQRLADLQARHAHLPTERERDEAILAGIADLENNVRYHQVSPRHFEAIACGSVQLLYPGAYSGLLQPGRHYFQLERDLSNLEEALALLRDEPRRRQLALQAHEEVVLDRRNWIEAFVERVDARIAEILEARGRTRRPALASAAPWPLAWLGEPSAAGSAGRRLRIVLGPIGMAAPQLREAEGELVLPRRDAREVLQQAGEASWWGTPAGTLAWQEMLLAASQLALDEFTFCALHGIPPQQARTVAARERLQAALDLAAAAAAVAAGLRGLPALAVSRAECLPAALVLKAAVGTPLAVATDALLPPGAAEGEVHHWTGVLERAAAHVDAWLSPEHPGVAADGPPAAEAQDLQWFAPPARPYYHDPARAGARPGRSADAAGIPLPRPFVAPAAPRVPLWRRAAGSSSLRRAWRLLPEGLRHRILTRLARREEGLR